MLKSVDEAMADPDSLKSPNGKFKCICFNELHVEIIMEGIELSG
jgi:hypothetical protein